LVSKSSRDSYSPCCLSGARRYRSPEHETVQRAQAALKRMARWKISRGNPVERVKSGINAPAVHSQLRETPHTWVEWSCSQLLQNTPLHPIVEWGRQRFGGSDVPAEQRLADLESTLTQVKLDSAESASLLAPLLDIPLSSERSVELVPEELRRRQMAALTNWVMAGARAQPIVLAIEDAHWADPTTLELLRPVEHLDVVEHLDPIGKSNRRDRTAWLESTTTHSDIRATVDCGGKCGARPGIRRRASARHGDVLRSNKDQGTTAFRAGRRPRIIAFVCATATVSWTFLSVFEKVRDRAPRCPDLSNPLLPGPEQPWILRQLGAQSLTSQAKRTYQ
jgi:hypothetical protein